MIISPGLWKNNKTGHLYLVTGTVMNTTNDREGEIMVEYRNNFRKYVRALDEFLSKFTFIEGIN